MAQKEVKVKIRVSDDGSLELVQKKSKGAAAGIDDLSKSTDNAGKSTNTLRRNLHGAADMTSNSTKGFSKMSQGITGSLVPAYAVLASNVFALTAAFGFFKRAADVRILEESQKTYAENTGIALSSITMRLREASDGMLGFKEAGQAAAIGLAKGFSPSQLEQLAEGARKASTALGRDFQDSFDRLVRGASKAEPELLDELGITLRLEEATQKYAEAIGKNRDELNTYQRSQAVLLETQRQLVKNFGAVEAQTNPFQRLAKTLEDIIKAVTQFFLPAFEAFAGILNKSGAAAIAVFSLFAMSIIKSLLPLADMEGKIDVIGEASQKSLEKAEQAVKDYDEQILEASASLDELNKKGAEGVSKGAKDKSYANTESPMMKRAAAGTMTGSDKANLKKSLDAAIKEHERFGKIKNKIHKDTDIKILREMRENLKKMTKSEKKFGKDSASIFKKISLRAGRLWAKIELKGAKAFKALGKAAKWAGKQINKAMKIGGIVGAIVMVKDMIESLMNAPYSLALNFAKGFDMIVKGLLFAANFMLKTFAKIIDFIINLFSGSFSPAVAKVMNALVQGVLDGLAWIINQFIKGANKLLDWVNKFLPDDKQLKSIGDVEFKFKAFDENTEPVSKLADSIFQFNTEFSMAQDLLKNSDIGKALLEFETGQKELEMSTEALKEFKTQNQELANNLTNTLEGMALEEDLLKRNKMGFQALFSLDIPGQYEKIFAKRQKIITLDNGEKKRVKVFVMNDKARKEALADLQTQLGRVAEISPKMGEALKNATLKGGKGLKDLSVTVRDANANLKFFEEGITDTAQQVREALAGGDMYAARDALVALRDAGNNAGNAIIKLGGTSVTLKDLQERFKEMFGEDVDANALLERIQVQIAGQERINTLRAIGTHQSDYMRKIGEVNLAISETRLKIAAAESELALATTQAEKDRLNAKIKLLEIELKLSGLKGSKTNLDEMQKYGGTKMGSGVVQNMIEQQAAAAALATELDRIKKLEDANTIDSKEADALREIALWQQKKSAILGAANAMKSLGAEFKAMGPEGEYMGTMLDSIGNMTGALTLAFEEITKEGASMSQKVVAGLTAISAIIGAISQIQQAATKQRVKAIDKEIEAEKKRDGKSKGSLDTIKKLEAKKDAVKRKAFEQEKKMKIAQAIIATSLGAIQAYTSMAALGPVGMAIGAALAAMIVAMGAKQISMISSMQYEGGSGNVSSGPATVSAGKRKTSVDLAKSQSASGELAYMRGAQGMGGPENFTPAFTGAYHRAAGGRTGYVVGEQGPELFVPDQPGRIVTNDESEGFAQPSQDITFNINAIDAVGVADVLEGQRGNIIGMIRGAANEYGSPFLENIDTTIYTNDPLAGYRRA